jgi:hypothetical protein
MSLKKMVVAIVAATWPVFSGLTFLACWYTEPRDRPRWADRPAKRAVLIAAGPVPWAIASVLRLYAAYAASVVNALAESFAIWRKGTPEEPPVRP